MAFPSLTVIAQKLSEADIQRLLLLKRAGPKVAKLEARRDALAGELAEVERQLAVLTGDAAPKRKPGRKPGRPRLAPMVEAKADKPPVETPLIRIGANGRDGWPRTGRKVRRTKAYKPDERADREIRKTEDAIRRQVLTEYEAAKKAKRTPEQQAAINARMAKARAARAAKAAPKP